MRLRCWRPSNYKRNWNYTTIWPVRLIKTVWRWWQCGSFGGGSRGFGGGFNSRDGFGSRGNLGNRGGFNNRGDGFKRRF